MQPRSKSMAGWLVLAATGAALTVLAALGACANGATTDDFIAETAPDAKAAGCGCKNGEKCQNGVCVPDSVDSDGDGVSDLTDCDDKDPTVHPGATEVCNGKDDNCDGKVDESVDNDGDGYSGCPENEAEKDCDDTNADIHPGAKEVCNGKDDDCNGVVDDIPAALNPTLSDAHWKLMGTAAKDGDWVKLTSSAKDQVGGLLWNASYTFDHFEAGMTFKVDPTTDPADGVAFVWLQGTNPVLGKGGSAFGVGGLAGYVVAIDTYTNNDDTPYTAPFLSVLNAKNTANRLTRKQLPSSVVDGNPHTLRIVLKGGKLTVSVDDTEQLKDFAVPGYAPFAGYWGASASTGAFFGTHSVKDLTMAFPDGQGCVK